MRRSEIELIAPSELKSWERNARTHSKKQLRQIAESIETFGFTNPVLIDRGNRILAGHGRVAAAKKLGMEHVPCLRIEHMTHAEKRAYVLADNKLALNAGWDEPLLAEELGALLEIPELSFDIGVTGFSIAEIDTLIEDQAPDDPGDPADDMPVAEAPRRCQAGDIWQLGGHRLVCGDALNAEVVTGLMAGETARMVFSDPPYNMPIDGHVGNSGKVQHPEFAMAAGEMGAEQFTDFLRTAFQNLAEVSIDGGSTSIAWTGAT